MDVYLSQHAVQACWLQKIPERANERTSGEARGWGAGSRLRRLREWENLSDQGNVKIVASRLALYSCWGQKDSLLTRSRQKDSPIKMQACLSPRWLCQESKRERQTEKARETETDRDRERERQTETDRQRDREREGERERERGRPERERHPPRHDVIRYAWKTHATGATGSSYLECETGSKFACLCLAYKRRLSTSRDRERVTVLHWLVSIAYRYTA